MNQTVADKPQDLVVPVELLQAVANYLITCPYKDVAHLLAQLNQLQPPPPPPDAP